MDMSFCGESLITTIYYAIDIAYGGKKILNHAIFMHPPNKRTVDIFVVEKIFFRTLICQFLISSLSRIICIRFNFGETKTLTAGGFYQLYDRLTIYVVSMMKSIYLLHMKYDWGFLKIQCVF